MNFQSFGIFQKVTVEPGSSLGEPGSHNLEITRSWKNVWGTQFLQVGNRFPENFQFSLEKYNVEPGSSPGVTGS